MPEQPPPIEICLYCRRKLKSCKCQDGRPFHDTTVISEFQYEIEQSRSDL